MKSFKKLKRSNTHEELKKVEKVQLFRDPPPFNLKLENILFYITYVVIFFILFLTFSGHETYNIKQAQESLAAAMSLNIIVTSWADDCIETTDFKLLQPSTGNKQHVTYNLYPLTFAFKGKP